MFSSPSSPLPAHRQKVRKGSEGNEWSFPRRGLWHDERILNADSHLQPIRLRQLGNREQGYWVIDTSLEHGEDFPEASKEVKIDPSDNCHPNPRSTPVLIGKECILPKRSVIRMRELLLALLKFLPLVINIRTRICLIRGSIR